MSGQNEFNFVIRTKAEVTEFIRAQDAARQVGAEAANTANHFGTLGRAAAMIPGPVGSAAGVLQGMVNTLRPLFALLIANPIVAVLTGVAAAAAAIGKVVDNNMTATLERTRETIAEFKNAQAELHQLMGWSDTPLERAKKAAARDDEPEMLRQADAARERERVATTGADFRSEQIKAGNLGGESWTEVTKLRAEAARAGKERLEIEEMIAERQKKAADQFAKQTAEQTKLQEQQAEARKRNEEAIAAQRGTAIRFTEAQEKAAAEKKRAEESAALKTQLAAEAKEREYALSKLSTGEQLAAAEKDIAQRRQQISIAGLDPTNQAELRSELVDMMKRRDDLARQLAHEQKPRAEASESAATDRDLFDNFEAGRGRGAMIRMVGARGSLLEESIKGLTLHNNRAVVGIRTGQEQPVDLGSEAMGYLRKIAENSEGISGR